MTYQSKYFKDSEVACECGCGMLPTEEMMKAADTIREAMQAV